MKSGTYVDDGATSSKHREVIEQISKELGPLYAKYSFSLKYCIKSYLPNDEGKVIEEILGLTWDVEADTLRPHLDIYLSAKKRGMYIDAKLSAEGILAAIITQRLLLRVVGQCYDLSGRHICPLLIAGRLCYGLICKLKLGWDGACSDQVVQSNARKFLHEVLDVSENLKPMERAWVPVGFNFCRVICPVDGGDSAFAAHGYCRSEAVDCETAVPDTNGICSRLAVARCKVSNLSVPDNKQASLLLGTRVVQHMMEVLPEPPKEKVVISFVLDSQCTALTLNPSLSQKERRRHNVSIRTHRNLGNLSAMNGGLLVELFWAPGTLNPADLSSKTHANLAKVLNSSFYRNGHESYSSQFPPVEAKLFATVEAGVFKFRGLTSLSEHTSHCHMCSS